MQSVIQQIRSAFTRAADRLGGHHVPVLAEPPPVEQLQSGEVRKPPIDVFESDEELLILADTPGAFTDNTKLHWGSRSTLSLHVRRPDEPTNRSVSDECVGGDWYRTLSLPEYVDPDRTRATVRDGVLKVHVPKQATLGAVSIPVTAS